MVVSGSMRFFARRAARTPRAPCGRIAARRIVERERRERIEHAVAARDAAVQRFDADDGDDVFRRHAALGGDALEGLAVLLPELHAVGDALLGEEALAILPPRRARFSAGLLMSSMIFGCGSALGEQLRQRVAVERVALRDVVDERAGSRRAPDRSRVGRQRSVLPRSRAAAQRRDRAAGRGIVSITLRNRSASDVNTAT